MADRRGAPGTPADGGEETALDRSGGAFKATCSECSYSVVIDADDPDVDATDEVLERQAEHHRSHGTAHVLEFDRTRPFVPGASSPEGERADD